MMQQEQQRQFLGKHRGKVINNVDPLLVGRLQVTVPAVTGLELGWALPCVPYAGLEVGSFALPPIGADVWVEFEGGNPNLPIWSGCFWNEGESPQPAIPEFKIFKTESVSLTIDDTPGAGGLVLVVGPPAIETPVRLTIDAAGLQVTVGPTTALLMTSEDTITLTTPPAELTLAGEAISLNIEPSSMELTEAGIEIASEDVNVTAAVAVEGDVNVVGAVELEGNVNIAGGVEVESDEITVASLNVEVASLAVEVEAAAIALNGAVVIDGAAEVNGDLLIDGLQPVVIPI